MIASNPTAGDKRLNEMNRLGDMGHFPATVNAGATANVLLTLLLTWWLAPRFPQPWSPVVWVAVVLACNLLPVLLLPPDAIPGDAVSALACDELPSRPAQVFRLGICGGLRQYGLLGAYRLGPLCLVPCSRGAGRDACPCVSAHLFAGFTARTPRMSPLHPQTAMVL